MSILLCLVSRGPLADVLRASFVGGQPSNHNPPRFCCSHGVQRLSEARRRLIRSKATHGGFGLYRPPPDRARVKIQSAWPVSVDSRCGAVALG